VPKLTELNPNVKVSVLMSNPEASGKEELKAFKGLVRELKKRSFASDDVFVEKLAELPASGARDVLRALLASGKIDVEFVRSSQFDADDMLLACVEAGRVAKAELADFLGAAATPAENLFAAAVASHDMVVLTSSTRSAKVKWNKFCRNFAVTATSDRLAETKTPLPIGFISCDMRGLAGSAFVDFGPGFLCRDANGEAEVTRVITAVDGDTVSVDVAHVATGVHGVNVESEAEGWIKFSGVKGMVDAEGVSINDSGAWRAKLVEKVVRREKAGTDGEMEIAVQTNGSALRIGSTAAYSAYEGGGTVTSSKQPFPLSFVSYEDALLSGGPKGSTWDNMEPSRMDADWQVMMRPQTLHIAFIAIMEYQERHDGALPPANDAAAADEVVAIATAHNDALKAARAALGAPESILVADDLDTDVVRTVALMAATEIQPVACFFGGVLAQEIVKYTVRFLLPLHFTRILLTV
jgi:ubiquitin-activating enzyme E1